MRPATAPPGGAVGQQRFVLTVEQMNLLCARIPHLERPPILPRASGDASGTHIAALVERGALLRRPDPRSSDWTQDTNPLLALLIAQHACPRAVVRMCTWRDAACAEHTVAILGDAASHLHLSGSGTAVTIELTAVAQVWQRLHSCVASVLGEDAVTGDDPKREENATVGADAPNDGYHREVVVTPHAVGAISEAGRHADGALLAAAVDAVRLETSRTVDQDRLIALARSLEAPVRAGIRVTVHAASDPSRVALTWLRAGHGWLRVRTQPPIEHRTQNTGSRSEAAAEAVAAPVMLLPQCSEHVQADLLHLVTTVVRGLDG